VGPDERASLANNNKADLLISLHANASLRKDVSGAQVFYLSADLDASAAEASPAARQSLPTVGGGMRDIEIVPWNMAQVRYLSESAALAGGIEEQFRNRVRLNARPVQRAPMRVLAGVNMPAVLVEAGFLSNPDEEQQLASDAYQATITQALLDAIVAFRDLTAARAQQNPGAGAAAMPPVPLLDAPIAPARREPGALRPPAVRHPERRTAGSRRRR